MCKIHLSRNLHANYPMRTLCATRVQTPHSIRNLSTAPMCPTRNLEASGRPARRRKDATPAPTGTQNPPGRAGREACMPGPGSADRRSLTIVLAVSMDPRTTADHAAAPGGKENETPPPKNYSSSICLVNRA